jgi:large subunit ribosomal protein L30
LRFRSRLDIPESGNIGEVMKKLQVTLKKSVIGSNKSQRATVAGLGLKKMNQTRILNNTPAIRGMVKKVIHLVDVQEVEVED